MSSFILCETPNGCTCGARTCVVKLYDMELESGHVSVDIDYGISSHRLSVGTGNRASHYRSVALGMTTQELRSLHAMLGKAIEEAARRDALEPIGEPT